MSPDQSHFLSLHRPALLRPRIMLLLLVLAGLPASALSTYAQAVEVRSAAPVRLLSPIDEHTRVTLQGHVRRDLAANRDLGPVEDSMPMHLYLVLQRTPAQQADLENLIARQQERTAPEYHQWLTPKQYGARFGVHPDDIAKLTSWLNSHGFEVRSVLNNSSMIDFAGTAGQIREAFHTEMHYWNMPNGKFAANAQDPQIPAALAQVVAGVMGLDKVAPHMHHTAPRQAALDKETHTYRLVNPTAAEKARPGYSDGYGDYLVAPGDLYTIYNVSPIFTGGHLGSTAKVAVIEESDIEYGTVTAGTGVATGGDVATFRTLFGVAGTLNMHVYHGYGTVTCTAPGVDPDGNGEDEEASLDAEWINATAPSANLIFMSCDQAPDNGVFTSMAALVDNNLSDVMSMSYGEGEADLAPTDPAYAMLDSLETQAATQGQSIFISAGDSGSDVADQNTEGTATSGINVSAFGSPMVTVAGGTDFSDFYDAGAGGLPVSTYWGATNAADGADALSYVPETAWNNSCASSIEAESNGYSSALDWCGALDFFNDGSVVGGSGGISTHYKVPAWQTGTSGYSNTYHSQPDVSGFAANGAWYHALLFCDSSAEYSGAFDCSSSSAYGEAGGTSFVAPYLAGATGLLVDVSGSRQGLLNPTLYALAKAQYTNPATSTACYSNGQTSNTGVTTKLPAASCIFNDVTTSNNDVPCQEGTTNCYVDTTAGYGYGMLSASTTALAVAYNSEPGFDQVTGLGTLNIANLITKWNTAFTSATTLAANPTSITSSESTTLTTTVTGGAPADYVDTPPALTGKVTIKDGTTTLGSCTLTNGKCTFTVPGTSLAPGPNSLTGTFSGSGTYPSSTSSIVTVTLPGSGDTPTTLTSPVQGAVLAGSSVTFTWPTEPGASGYFLHLGTTGAGSLNLLNSTEYSASTTSVTISGLPVNGEKIYARVFTDYDGTHVYTDSTFTAAQQSVLTSPTSPSTLVGPNVTFTWSAATGSSVKGYFLHIGSTGVGSDNLLNSAEYSSSTTSAAVSGLPLNGGPIYVRVYTDYNGTHLYQDYTFTAATQAGLSSPTQSSTLAGPFVTFDWSAASGSNVKGYFLHLGNTGVGSDNLLNSPEYPTTSLSAVVNNLPVSGGTLYARIYTDYNGTHVYKDYTFTEAKQALLTSPAQGATLSGATVTFDWSAATGSSVKGYFLHLGTTGVGSMNLLNSAEYSTSTLSVTVNNLPVTGGTVYARIYTDYNGVHVYQDYTFTAH